VDRREAHERRKGLTALEVVLEDAAGPARRSRLSGKDVFDYGNEPGRRRRGVCGDEVGDDERPEGLP
jgi:hypothetical protein